MSIIENAARRLEQVKQSPSVRTDARAGEPAKQTPARLPNLANANAQPAGQASAAPTPPKHHVEIDLERLQQMGMVVSNGERSAVAEEFRVIKRPLLRTAAGLASRSAGNPRNPPNLIMVTSSLPGEGKTFCAINLAMSIATEKDYTVLLVDADVARPSIPKALGISAEIGMMDILCGERKDIADVLVHTNVPSLSLITAGKGHRYTTELLASQDMATMVAELARRYPDRIVIFDSPPLLATTEAQVLAMHMGQIVVVVEAERTTQSQLQEALRHLDGCPNVSLLYNKARRFSTETAYGYY